MDRYCIDCGATGATETYHSNTGPVPLCSQCADALIASPGRAIIYDAEWSRSPFHHALTRLVWSAVGHKALALTPTDGWLEGGCWTFADALYAWAIRTRLYKHMPVTLVGLAGEPGGCVESMHAIVTAGHGLVRVDHPLYGRLYVDATGINYERAVRRYWGDFGDHLYIVPMDRGAMRQECPVWDSASKYLATAFSVQLPTL